jgi:hypothetical protein
MKLSNLIKEQVSERRTKILLSEDQFRRLALRILSEQEQGTIKSTYLIKQNSNVKKK